MWLAFPALLLAVLIAYQPAWHGGVLWDDERHLTSVDLQGLGGLGRIWFEIGATQQYYPLLHSAFWVLHRFFGDSTLGYHLVNIGLHAGSAFLLLLILRRLSAPGAELAAVIFALHPVHVESVAWIAELKNTLSGVMYLGSALAYVHFHYMRRTRSYVLSLVLFVFALLTKSVTAVLPVIIALALWWRHGRLSWRRDLVPLVPFVALATVAGIVTAWIERTLLKAEGSEFAFTFIDRCLIAGRGIWFYLGKLVWPTALLFNYPRWQIDAMAWRQYVYPVAAVCVLVGLWAIRSRLRAPLAAMLMFCASLVPVLGFLNVYPFR